MSDTWLDRWNERYRNEAFAYGTLPNQFLKEQLEKLQPGTILFPAEGEGRNAVFAAQRGWQVDAFDISEEGQKKAMRLAEAQQVTINYRVGELQAMSYLPVQFDAIAFIYAHFPAAIKSQYHQILSTSLRAGGMVIFEAFSKRHIDYVIQNPAVGGPRDIPSLFSVEELQADFSNFEFLQLEETEIELNEGLFHQGRGSVIRFIGRKN